MKERLALLTQDFPKYMEAFSQEPAFVKSGQYEHHRATVDLRLKFGSAQAALQSDAFLQSRYATLRAWGYSFPQNSDSEIS